MRKRRLAIIGASDFQNPLILKAKEMGLETYAFAWECGDVGERTADHFYPISTADKDGVLAVCREIGVDGVTTIGSDFNNITATYVANRLGLTANTDTCVSLSTNKHLMRESFAAHGDPSPRSILIERDDARPESLSELRYPVIVKPTDRSGSRGITKLDSPEGLDVALKVAFGVSWEGKALVEEFLPGDEFSVEFCSWEGEHHFLQMTRKYTTGAPHFIETGHIEPPSVSEKVLDSTKRVVSHALDTLGVLYGASHSEVKVNAQGEPWIVEIGSRMGGDCIGSDLVELSTGIDFVAAVVSTALGEKPNLIPSHAPQAAAVRFILSQDDVSALERLRSAHPEWLVRVSDIAPVDGVIVDSSSRDGFFIMAAPNVADLTPYLP